MSASTEVTFELPTAWVAKNPGLERLSLPIEVRDDKLNIVQQGTLQSSFELEPGNYQISAMLPVGEVVFARASVMPGVSRVSLEETRFSVASSVDADFSIDKAAIKKKSKNLSAETHSGAMKSQKIDDIAEFPDSARDIGKQAHVEHQFKPKGISFESEFETESVSVAAFAGNLLHGKFDYLPLPEGSAPDNNTFLPYHEVPLRVWQLPPDRRPPTYIQLFEEGRPVKNYAVPEEGDRPPHFTLLSREGELSIDVRLWNPDADLIMRYAGNNMFQEVSQIADGPALAKNLLQAKFSSPIGAAVGGYALLRLGELDRLHDWTKNLFRYFPWLPDGAVIYAEHLARVGKHQEALDALLDLTNRGLPFASSGLSYALNRLRIYQGAVKNRRLEGSEERVAALTEVLSQYAKMMDITRPLLMFFGSNPAKPDNEPASQSPAGQQAQRVPINVDPAR